MDSYHKLIIGDSRKMAEVKDQSVHLIITSPPYWQLKDYGRKNQIGFNESYENYVNNLNLVWDECYRVLDDGCRLCINIGDQFARSVYYGRYKIIPIRTEIIKFCETVGFDYMGAIIWQKVTTCNTTGGATIMGSFPFPRNGILKLDYEFILLFKKPGKTKKVQKDIKEKSKLTKEEWNKFFVGHWQFSGVRQDKHLAMFPSELPRRLIKMFSFVGDIVLDPFLGSGTTSLAAKNLSRHSIGYEINSDFLPYITEKVGFKVGDKHYLIENQSKITIKEFDAKIKKLPYIFKDPIKFDKKIDPRKQQYGSRITLKDNNCNSKKLYSVKEILSTNLISLDNGNKIQLLGIMPLKGKQNKAIDFLIKKTKGQKVYLTFDKTINNGNGAMLAYLYLKNKTFLNLHLLKNKLAAVDEHLTYRYKSRFLKVFRQGGVS